MRAVLNRAARSCRDDDGAPWLTGVPPFITMLPVSRQSPYPITMAPFFCSTLSERALLEVLSDVGVRQPLQEARGVG